MTTSLRVSTTNPSFQPILDKALEQYKKKTTKDLVLHTSTQMSQTPMEAHLAPISTLFPQNGPVPESRAVTPLLLRNFGLL